MLATTLPVNPGSVPVSTRTHLSTVLAAAMAIYCLCGAPASNSLCAKYHVSTPPEPPLEATLELVSNNIWAIDAGEIIELCTEGLSGSSQPDVAVRSRLYEHRADALASLRQWDRAYDDYDQSILLRPDDGQLICKRARAALRLGHYEEAIHQVGNLLQSDNHRALAHAVLAEAEIFRGDMAVALRHAEEAIELSSNLPSAFYCRGLVHAVHRNFSLCIEDMTRVISLDPLAVGYMVSPYIVRASARTEVGQYNEALRDALMDIRLFGRSPGAVYTLAKAYFCSDRDNAALQLVLELGPPDACDIPTLRLGALVLSRCGRQTEALEWSERLVAMTPQDAGAYCLRATVHSALNDYELALRDYDRALGLKPKLWRAMMQKAWLLSTCPRRDLRDEKGAVDLARVACDGVAWREHEYVICLAVSYAEVGKFDEATRVIERSINLVSQDPELKARYEFWKQRFSERRSYTEVISIFESGNDCDLVRVWPEAISGDIRLRGRGGMMSEP